MTKDPNSNESTSSALRLNSALNSLPPAAAITHIIDQNQDNHSHFVKESYRHYSLSFYDTQTMCIGEIFKGKDRLAYCEALDIESARQYCRQIVDERLIKESMGNVQGKPDLNKLIQAMKSIQEQIDEHCQNLLFTHLKNGNQANSIDQLKTQGGFHSTTAVFLSYAEWARLLCDALTYLPPASSSGKDPFLNMVIHSQESDIYASNSLMIALQPDIYEALTHIHRL
jgi:hypothetical protein